MTATVRHGPQRIVCLTEEPTEVLYALGQQDRIVGISGFTVRPPRARREKPKVSAFTSAKIDEILKLEPDFVVGFSDIQADIAAELVRRGVEVWISNHRSGEGILDYVRRLGALVGVRRGAEEVPMAADVTATVTDLRGQRRDLAMRGLHGNTPSGDTVLDYFGVVEASPPDTLRFDIDVQWPGGRGATLRVDHELRPD